MKKIILINLFIAINIFGYSQPQIEGLGKLRINMHEADFLEMFTSNYYGKPIVLKTSAELLKAVDRKAYKLNFNVVNERTVFYTRCKRARMYYLKSFSIGDNIEIKDVYVTFFDSSLLDLVVEFSEVLREDLFAKYGSFEPRVITNLSEGSQCKDALEIAAEQIPELPPHGKFKLTSIKLDYEFRNDSINAVASTRRFYDENCKIKNDDVIRIFNVNAFQEFVKCH